MNTYPTLPTASGSDFKPIGKTGIQIDRAEDGTAYARSYGTDKGAAKIEHPYITAAQKSTLDSFYSANKLLKYTYVSPTDGVSRTCLFAGAISYKRESVQGERYTATVLMEEA